MGYVLAPLHNVHIQSKLIKGFFPVAVRPCFPTEGVWFIMGNDIAGGKVYPVPEVVDSPILESEPDDSKHPNFFPVGVLTGAQACKSVQDINLSDSRFASALSKDVMSPTDGADSFAVQPVETEGEVYPPPLPLTCEALIRAQESDPSLVKCFDTVN